LSVGDDPFNFPLLGASDLGISPLLLAVATGSDEFSSLFLYKNVTHKYVKVSFSSQKENAPSEKYQAEDMICILGYFNGFIY
jgi:hypothetical protein